MFTRVAVSGHRGLSPDVSALVVAGIEAQLDRIAPGDSDPIGLSCLADGAGQLFAAAVLDRGGSLDVVVPAEEYREGLPEAAQPQYDAFLSRASRVHHCLHRESTAESHMDASRYMVVQADYLLAVWDGEPAGTADVVLYAQGKGIPVAVVWLEGARRD
ncbi:hypothetical protein [Salinispora arenicola]|uniref:hypothetical protein n=1 Tax=Salinispora arenicola TaxID=168697 RepID=UPI000577C56D|nr:hypothetical protein [Salinispora arenicola]